MGGVTSLCVFPEILSDPKEKSPFFLQLFCSPPLPTMLVCKCGFDGLLSYLLMYSCLLHIHLLKMNVCWI